MLGGIGVGEGGPGACYLGKLDKNGAIWCILSVSKYMFVIINLKINTWMNNKSRATKIISHISPPPPNQSRWACYTKINIFTFYNLGLGKSPSSQRKFIKTSNKMEAFPLR